MESTPSEMNLSQKLAVLAMDLLMLAEVGIAMYLATRNPETLTPVFLKTFMLMLLPTLAAGYLAVRKLRSPTEQVAA